MNALNTKKSCFRFLILSLSAVFIFSLLTGCLMRTYPKTIERVDLQIQGQGNEGYVLGTPPAGRTKIEKETRQIQVLEIEVSNPLQVFKEEPKTVPQQTYATGRLQTEEETLPQTQTVISAGESSDSTQQSMDTYIVQKNDTLQKIAARPEIYGTYKKWRKIYDTNRDALSSPDRIYQGQILRIPRD